MRIVSRAEFLKLPAGTVWAYYEPHVFSGLFLKGETWWGDKTQTYGDFVECELINTFDPGPGSWPGDAEADLRPGGKDIPLTFGEETSREGYFDDTQLYAVWSREDVAGLAAFLAKLAR